MTYVKPMLVATVSAMSNVQFGIAKPGQNPDNENGTTTAYRSDE